MVSYYYHTLRQVYKFFHISELCSKNSFIKLLLDIQIHFAIETFIFIFFPFIFIRWRLITLQRFTIETFKGRIGLLTSP